jgi:hypothetical protein
MLLNKQIEKSPGYAWPSCILDLKRPTGFILNRAGRSASEIDWFIPVRIFNQMIIKLAQSHQI